jgi:hypothetical protein
MQGILSGKRGNMMARKQHTPEHHQLAAAGGGWVFDRLWQAQMLVERWRRY